MSNIQPFNLNRDERRAMYEAPLPDEMILAVSMMRDPDVCNHCVDEEYNRIHDGILECMDDCISNAASFGISADIVLAHGIVDNPLAMWLQNTPEQLAWQVEGLYFQAGFICATEEDIDDLSASACLNMSVYDRHAGSNVALDPHLHPDIPVSEDAAEQFRNLTGDMYRTGTGLLTSALLKFRDMVMIKGRAVQTGTDPDLAYKRFLQKNMRYCLEFVR